MEVITRNIYRDIKELSDLALQRKLWLNENNDTGQISSYAEVMSRLFDEENFDHFVDNVSEKIGIPSSFIIELNKLRDLLNAYGEKKTDEEIINDPEWKKIVKQAKVIIKEWDSSKALQFIVLNGKVNIAIPNDFHSLTPSTIENKYPIEGRRPSVVYANENESVTIAFNHTNEVCTLEQLPEYKENAFDKVFNQPTVESYKSKIEEINGRNFIILQFIVPAQDTKTHVQMLITSLEDRLLMISIGCPQPQFNQWATTFKKIIDSIKVIAS